VNLYGISENAPVGAEAASDQLSWIARKVRPIENPPADPAKYTGKSDQASYRCRGDLLFGSYLDQIENVAQGRLEPR